MLVDIFPAQLYNDSWRADDDPLNQDGRILDNEGNMAKSIMIQGTMSSAGKSFLAAGLCRVFRQDGYRVAPFKSQNMALNSYVTKEGLEMGRAQVMQAEACGEEPSVLMNPILLKPTTDIGSQVIVNGVPKANMKASDYFKYKTSLIPDIMESYRRLAKTHDIIVIEGAGSPAEINLKKQDIVNMGLAKLVDAPVLLVGDIDRGGVFAQLSGTLQLLEEEERRRVKGFVMNKFRGDKEILKPGLEMLKEITQVDTIGVIPYAYLDLDDEDSLSERLCRPADDSGQPRQTGERAEQDATALGKTNQSGLIRIAVVRLPRISNFTDFNVLEAMNEVRLSYVTKPEQLKDPDLIILPGTKSTVADMKWLRESGLEARILQLTAKGVTLFGICGGYQMLGERILDPEKTEGMASIRGMGLFPMETTFEEEKVRSQVSGNSGKLSGIYRDASKLPLKGYEIHMGRSRWQKENDREGADLPGADDHTEGCIRQKDHIFGTYLHGIFDAEEFRTAFLTALLKKKGMDNAVVEELDYRAYKETQYDKLADLIRTHLDMERVYQIMGLENTARGSADPGNAGEAKGVDGAAGESADPGNAGKAKGVDGAARGSADPGKSGCIHLYHGEGKGKTTAAVGLAIRAAGAGKKVIFCQMLKSADTGEIHILKSIPGITILRSEKKFGFSWTLTDQEKAELKAEQNRLIAQARSLAAEGWCDMLVLDEICGALGKNLVDQEPVFALLREFTGERVLTGRNPGQELTAMADYITRMDKEKHPYDLGVAARRGVEY